MFLSRSDVVTGWFNPWARADSWPMLLIISATYEVASLFGAAAKETEWEFKWVGVVKLMHTWLVQFEWVSFYGDFDKTRKSRMTAIVLSLTIVSKILIDFPFFIFQVRDTYNAVLLSGAAYPEGKSEFPMRLILFLKMLCKLNRNSMVFFCCLNLLFLPDTKSMFPENEKFIKFQSLVNSSS